MSKKLIYIIAFLLPYISIGQIKSTLSQLLWDNVQSCYSNFENINGENSDLKIVDDSKNGYLSVSGSFPTCGCYCSSTVGAYKDTEGNYTLLHSDFSGCNWEKQTTSNKSLSDILPEDFGIHNFTSQEFTTEINNPIFFLEAEIPQIGTDTKVKLQLVPFGMYLNKKDIICYSYSETNTEKKSFYHLIEMVQSTEDENFLDYILQGQFDLISQVDTDRINKNIKNNNFKSELEIQEQLKELKAIYEVYLQIELTELLLGWNRETARFYIKDKGERQKFVTFKEFLMTNLYWSAMC